MLPDYSWFDDQGVLRPIRLRITMPCLCPVWQSLFAGTFIETTDIKSFFSSAADFKETYCWSI
jgi:hypothetical protein